MKNYRFSGTSVASRNKFHTELKEIIGYVEELKEEAKDDEISDFMDKIAYKRIIKSMINNGLLKEVPERDNKPIL